MYMELFPEHGLVVEGPPLFFDPTNASSTAQTPLSRDIPPPSFAPHGKEPIDIVGFAFAAPDLASMTHLRDNLRRGILRSKYPKDEALQRSDGVNGMTESILRKSSFNSTSTPQITVDYFIKVCPMESL